MSGKCKNKWKSQSGVAINFMKCDQKNVNNNSNSKHPVVIVVIPGNPGPISIYDKFSETLNLLTNIPVWGISHTGHVKLGNSKGLEHPAKEDCGLEKQILHKIEFIKSEVLPYAEKVILIGHSIGCYIILQIIDRMQSDQIVKGFLLFPTIEKMSSTPKGKIMTPLLSNARWLFVILAGVLSYFPEALKNMLVSTFVKTKEKCIVDSIKSDMTNSQAVDSMTYMALEEMFEVDKRDDHILEKHMDKLIFYYGVDDHWCPVSFYKDVCSEYKNPQNVLLCEKNIPHAFVLTHSVEGAHIVSKWVHDLKLEI